MSRKYAFVVHGQTMSKKRNWTIVRNHRGFVRIALKKKYKQWEDGVASELWVHKIEMNLREPLDEPLAVAFEIYLSGHGKTDLSNFIQGLEDALVCAGIIRDDSLIESYDGSRKYMGTPKGEERAIITITPFEEGSG